MKHTPHSSHEIERLLRGAENLGLSRSAKLRLTWFQFALEHSWNVSLTCRYFGIARSTFVRWFNRFDPRHPETLEKHSPSSRTVCETNEDPVVVAFIEGYRKKDPYADRASIRDRLQKEYGVIISASTVGRIIQRNGFFFGSTPAHRTKRGECEDFSPSTSQAATPTHPDVREEGEADFQIFDTVRAS